MLPSSKFCNSQYFVCASFWSKTELPLWMNSQNNPQYFSVVVNTHICIFSKGSALNLIALSFYWLWSSSLEIIHIFYPLSTTALLFTFLSLRVGFWVYFTHHIAINADKSFISMNHHNWFTTHLNQFFYSNSFAGQVPLFLCLLVSFGSTGPWYKSGDLVAWVMTQASSM